MYLLDLWKLPVQNRQRNPQRPWQIPFYAWCKASSGQTWKTRFFSKNAQNCRKRCVPFAPVMMVRWSDIFVEFTEQIAALWQGVSNFEVPSTWRQVIRISQIWIIHVVDLAEIYLWEMEKRNSIRYWLMRVRWIMYFCHILTCFWFQQEINEWDDVNKKSWSRIHDSLRREKCLLDPHLVAMTELWEKFGARWAVIDFSWTRVHEKCAMKEFNVEQWFRKMFNCGAKYVG